VRARAVLATGWLALGVPVLLPGALHGGGRAAPLPGAPPGRELALLALVGVRAASTGDCARRRAAAPSPPPPRGGVNLAREPLHGLPRAGGDRRQLGCRPAAPAGDALLTRARTS
jgi:hypothetical protein